MQRKSAKKELFHLKRKRSHSYPFFYKNKNDIKHDSFCNNKRKSSYESELALLFLQNTHHFMPIIKKTSALILPDIIKISNELKENNPPILSNKMHEFLINDFDLKILFHSSEGNLQSFYNDMIHVLQSEDQGNFYKHMCIQFSFITFFTKGNIAKPELEQAVSESWCKELNLNKFMSDMNEYRDDENLFKNYHRLNRNYIKEKVTSDVGILPLEAYNFSEKAASLKDKLVLHQAGKLMFFITTVCDSSAEAVHIYDLPQLCGPSGTTAKRLALANQANLDRNEMQLMLFSITLFNVAIGAHTIDECFMIAKKANFNSYVRGDYTSIIPNVIKDDKKFSSLWKEIQILNDKYSDILISNKALSLNQNLNKC